MQAMLVLYMVEQLLLAEPCRKIAGLRRFSAFIESVTGPLSVQALASQIFGSISGWCASLPFLGACWVIE